MTFIEDIAVQTINSLSGITSRFNILDIGCHRAGVLLHIKPKLSLPSYWIGFDPSNHGVGFIYDHYFETAVDNVSIETEKIFNEFPVEPGCNSLLSLNVMGITHDKTQYDQKCYVRPIIENDIRSRKIKVNSASNLLKNISYTGPTHFVKIDTQGNDINVVKSFGEYLSKIYYIQIETITSHNKNITLYEKQTIFEEDVEEMKKLGFDVFYIEDYSIGKNECPEANVIFMNTNLLTM